MSGRVLFQAWGRIRNYSRQNSRETLEREARFAAIADAQDRADQLAEALDITLGAPIQVSESFGGVPFPVERVAFDMAVAESAPPISQGELTVSVNVNVQFRIEP